MNRNPVGGLFNVFSGAGSTEKAYGTVLSLSKTVESQLRELGYSGRGIHALVTCAGSDLPIDVVGACRKVATIRNKLVHELEFVLTRTEVNSFAESANFVIKSLKEEIARRAAAEAKARGGKSAKKVTSVTGLFGLAAAGAAAFLFGN